VDKKLSVVINNFNYGRFLSQAIESVLDQSPQPWEIIVVDDGSTDSSTDIIKNYTGRIKSIFKENGGQASAFNAGFNAATGDWIWFVDSDDILLPGAITAVTNAIAQGIVKIHSPLLVIDKNGVLTGDVQPGHKLSDGFVLKEMINSGDYSWPPTTGNIFSRSMLNAIMPVPEETYRLCADFYLCSFAGVYGEIKSLETPVGCYRVHGENGFTGFSIAPEKIRSNGLMLINTVKRIEDLIRSNTENAHYTYPYSRSVLESLILAHRFGSLDLPPAMQGYGRHRLWVRSRQFVTAGLKAKIVGIVFWLVINYAPLSIAKKMVMAGITKHERARQHHLSVATTS
jgi:glycosyltransferase involved in cell wall biosynthesis